MSLTHMRNAGLWLIAALVAAATGAAFAESYRGLLDWALRHGLHGGWAYAWPLQVDTFIAVGELALFVALVDKWTERQRAGAWTVTLIGVAVSVAGNVGHAPTHDWASRLTFAVPPLAAAAALAVGLGVLKRVVAAREETSDSGRHTVRAKPAPTSEPLAKTSAPRPPGGRSRPGKATAGRSDPPAKEKAAQALLATFPNTSGREIGELLGVSPRQGQRRAAALRSGELAEPLIGDDELQDHALNGSRP